jgi:alpha-mannosidase
LLQHHDAITGTSKAAVMRNYLDRAFKSVKDTVNVQEQAINCFLNADISTDDMQNFNVTNEFVRINSVERAAKIKIHPEKSTSNVILFNSLAQERVELVSVRVSCYSVIILDAHDRNVPYQVNNVLNERGERTEDEFEVIFVAKLPALSLSTYKIVHDASVNSRSLASFEEIHAGSAEKFINIEGSKMKLTVDTEDGLIKFLEFKNAFLTLNLEISFGAYISSIGSSGAYLFQPDPDNSERNIFENDAMKKVIVIRGKIASYVTVIYGSLLNHTVRVLNTQTHLDNGVFIINDIEMNEKHDNSEMFMRISTPFVQNGIEPIFFTDLNNFQWQKRKNVASIGVEGNYYPITSSIFLQDNDMRVTLITNHAQGATSPTEGIIEVMLDRRTPVDDNRGMEEGVVDNLQNQQKYWLTFEHFNQEFDTNDNVYQVPSLHVHHLINALSYPVNLYEIPNTEGIEINKQVNLLKNPLPCDLHLFNLRALSDDFDKSFPSSSALLIVRKLNFDCQLFNHEDPFYKESCHGAHKNFENIDMFDEIHVKFAQNLSLTGNKNFGFISSFSEVNIESMELKTFNLTFG